MKCETCKWWDEQFCVNEYRCRYDPQIKVRYEKKKLSFDEWWKAGYNVESQQYRIFAEGVWSAAQENKGD